MRTGCFLPLITLVLVIMGVQGIYTALKNREMTEIDIAGFIAQPPESDWLKITGGELETLNAAYESSFGGKPKALYVPLVPLGVDSEAEGIRVLVLTKDPELLSFAAELGELDETEENPLAALELLAKHAPRLREARPVEGLVQFGIDESPDKRRKIADLFDSLHEDFVILEEGKKPSMGGSAAALLGGVALGGFLLRRGRTRTSPPAIPPSPPTLPR